MPIPNPQQNEEQDEFISRCMSFLMSEDPNRNNSQATAICFSQWKNKESKKLDDDGHIIIAENVPFIINCSINYTQENADK